VDGFIVKRQPWTKAQEADDESQTHLDLTLYTAAEAVRIVTALLYPVLPEAAAKIWAQLGMAGPVDAVRLPMLEDGAARNERTLRWGQLAAGQRIGEVGPVFPRIDLKPAMEKMRELEVQVTAEQNALLGKTEAPPAEAAPETPKIAIDDFAKVDLRVGLVLSAEPVKGADKLLHLKVDLGEAEPRTIVAGIAEAYQPEQLLNRKVVIVANLQPRKLRGLTSNGMIVAASVEGGKPVLAGFLEEIPVGARLK